MRIIILIMALLLAVAGLLPLIRYDDWWIRVFDFPRLQFFTLGLLVLGIFFIFWGVRTRWGAVVLGILVGGLLLQAHCILPYTPIYPKEVKTASKVMPDSSIALLIANVLMSNREVGKLVEMVRERDPDMFLALEPDDWWASQLEVIEETHPHTLKVPLDNRYGMLLYSRLELIGPEIKYLVSEEFPSMHMQVRLPAGDAVWLHFIHPEPPSPTEAEESTRRDAELLIVGKEVSGRDIPTIVAGDLNDVAWSHTTTLFQKISGLLDPRKGRGMFNTFHAKYPLLRWPLDHIFHSEHFMLGEMARLEAFGSDHFPVYGRLVLQPGAAAVQEKMEADQEDREEAEDTTEKVDQKDSI